MRSSSNEIRWALAAILLPVLTTWADDPTVSGSTIVRHDSSSAGSDVAFDMYVDLAFVAQAWQTKDPVALADAALQVVEGERILLRPHRMLPADELLELAVQAALAADDSVTLARLKKAAELHGKEKLFVTLTAKSKLQGASRGTAAPAIAIDDVTPEMIAKLQLIKAELREARITGDGAALSRLATRLTSIDGLPKAQQEYWKAVVQEAQDNLPAAETLSRLKQSLSQLPVPTQDYVEGVLLNDASLDFNNGIANTDSSLQSTSPPYIDRHGRIWSGTSNSGGTSVVVGNARKYIDADGRAWFYSDYADYGKVRSPVRADSRYDRQAVPQANQGATPNFRIDKFGRVYESDTILGAARHVTFKSGRTGFSFQIPLGWHVYRYDDETETRRNLPPQ